MNLKTYKSKKVVRAVPSIFKEWRDYNGWPVIGDSNPLEKGYIIIDGNDNYWMSEKDFEEEFDEVPKDDVL